MSPLRSTYGRLVWANRYTASGRSIHGQGLLQPAAVLLPQGRGGLDADAGSEAEQPGAQVAPAHGWEPLGRRPLPDPLALPLWLVLPAGWEQEPVLAHTAERLAALVAGCLANG